MTEPIPNAVLDEWEEFARFDKLGGAHILRLLAEVKRQRAVLREIGEWGCVCYHPEPSSPKSHAVKCPSALAHSALPVEESDA